VHAIKIITRNTRNSTRNS